jgi:hypothetical protein
MVYEKYIQKFTMKYIYPEVYDERYYPKVYDEKIYTKVYDERYIQKFMMKDISKSL